jgi:hypothetical protein
LRRFFMKKVLCIAGFLVLAALPPLCGYDSSPSTLPVVPEAIWAPATGGGTWVTEIQIINYHPSPANVLVYFDYNGGAVGPIMLYAGLAQFQSIRYSNILATIDSLDAGATVYFGKVGALMFSSSGRLLQVQAKTVNGNYGKTFPGLPPVTGNTAAEGRPMIIQDLVQNATYRTSVGAYNAGSISITVTFTIVDANDVTIGSSFTRTLGGYGFLSFNPFTQAGVPSGTYDNCWLYIDVTSGIQDNS